MPDRAVSSAVAVDGWSAYEDLIGREWRSLTVRQRWLVALGELRNTVGQDGFELYLSQPRASHLSDALAAASAAGLEGLRDLLGRAEALVRSGVVGETCALLDAEFQDLERREDLDAAMTRLTFET